MRITNAYNMRDLFYDLVVEQLTSNPYGKLGNLDFRTTELALSPYAFQLRRKFENTPQMIIDASRCMNLLFGTAFHKLTEFESTLTRKADKKVSGVFLLPTGITVTVYGAIDYWSTSGASITIIDWKTGKCSQVKYPVNQDYVWQVNVYKYLDFLERCESGMKILPYNLYVSMFLKDHTQVGYRKKKDIPMIPFHEVKVESYANDVVREYIEEKSMEKLQPDPSVCCEDYRSFGQCNGFDLRCKGYCDCSSVCPYARQMGYFPEEFLADAEKRENIVAN